jgi:glutathione peroxidase
MISIEEYISPWTLKYKKFFPAQVSQFKIKDFDLQFIDSRFQWDVLKNSPCILVVNTATGCGFHKQLADLQSLYDMYHSQGLCIISVPSGDFMNQEAHNGPELSEYCSLRYGVTFPILEKTHVLKENVHPLFQWINRLQKPQWNFQKYLFNSQGYCIASAGPRSSPFILEDGIKRLLKKNLQHNGPLQQASAPLRGLD